MRKVLFHRPVEIVNETSNLLSMQLSRATLIDANAEKEIAPEICLLVEQEDAPEAIIMLSVEQVDKFIAELHRLKSAAVNHSNSKLQ